MAGPVWAQTPEEQVRDMLDQAYDEYDLLELEAAEVTLNQALSLADAYDVEAALVADLHLMMGIVADGLYGDDIVTMDHFAAGLEVDRGAQLNPYYTNPDLDALFEEAFESLPPIEPEPTAPILSHQPAVTIRSGAPLTLTATTRDGAGVRRVVLAYRPHGETRFSRTNLRLSSPTEFHVTVPGTVTESAGIQLEYFLQALNSDDLVLASSGSATTPHVVVILDPDEGSSGEGLEHVVAITLGVGTGGGLATGEPIVMRERVDLNPGIALTPLHFLAEIMFHVGGIVELGPWSRIQAVLLEDAVEIETIFGLKGKFYFQADAPTRLYGSVGAGYGYVRHTVDLAPTVDFVDTTREGPFHAGAGVGIAHMFNNHVGILADFYFMVLFDTVSVQLDANLGLLLAF